MGSSWHVGVRLTNHHVLLLCAAFGGKHGWLGELIMEGWGGTHTSTSLDTVCCCVFSGSVRAVEGGHHGRLG